MFVRPEWLENMQGVAINIFQGKWCFLYNIEVNYAGCQINNI